MEFSSGQPLQHRCPGSGSHGSGALACRTHRRALLRRDCRRSPRRKASNLFDVDLSDHADRYSTLAGYILWKLGHLPEEGEKIGAGEFVFEVVAINGRALDKVRIRRAADTG